ncbi:MAG TPA: tetratricopeptide repeat protein [Blastocatellia bacterium]|jgi:hypothetical protein
MTIDWKIEKPAQRILVVALTAGIIALLGYMGVSNLVVGMMTGGVEDGSRQRLETAASYFPNSPRLNAQLARSELTSADRDLSAAESFARRAVELSPNDYNFQLLLATIQEARGERDEAAESYGRAIALAPNNAELRWRHANLLLRRGLIEQSFEEFRIAALSKRDYFPPTLDLIWRASGGSLDAVMAATPDDPSARFILAQFLLGQSLMQEAASVLRAIDRTARLQLRETPIFLDAMINAGEFQLARELWLDAVGEGGASADNRNLLWNSSFDSDGIDGFAHFDWGIRSSNFAHLVLDRETAHGGGRSLRVNFTGRDTTKLDGELRQLVVVRPGAQYRLTFFARAEKLVTPAGPRIAVVDAKTSKLIAASERLGAGSSDWQEFSIEFAVPAATSAILVKINRIPEFSYDDPTRGVVWYDDFALVEQSAYKTDRANR